MHYHPGAMFDGLQDKLQGVFRRLKGEGRVNEEALNRALKRRAES